MKLSLSLYNKSHKIKISEDIKKLFKSKLQMKKLEGLQISYIKH